jgi:hypothetical protein
MLMPPPRQQEGTGEMRPQQRVILGLRKMKPKQHLRLLHLRLPALPVTSLKIPQSCCARLLALVKQQTRHPGRKMTVAR